MDAGEGQPQCREPGDGPRQGDKFRPVSPSKQEHEQQRREERRVAERIDVDAADEPTKGRLVQAVRVLGSCGVDRIGLSPFDERQNDQACEQRGATLHRR